MVIHRFNCDSFTRSPLPINIILLIIQTNIVQGGQTGRYGYNIFNKNKNIKTNVIVVSLTLCHLLENGKEMQ
jgi:hypothetical protein